MHKKEQTNQAQIKKRSLLKRFNSLSLKLFSKKNDDIGMTIAILK